MNSSEIFDCRIQKGIRSCSDCKYIGDLHCKKIEGKILYVQAIICCHYKKLKGK